MGNKPSSASNPFEQKGNTSFAGYPTPNFSTTTTSTSVANSPFLAGNGGGGLVGFSPGTTPGASPGTSPGLSSGGMGTGANSASTPLSNQPKSTGSSISPNLNIERTHTGTYFGASTESPKVSAFPITSSPAMSEKTATHVSDSGEKSDCGSTLPPMSQRTSITSTTHTTRILSTGSDYISSSRETSEVSNQSLSNNASGGRDRATSATIPTPPPYVGTVLVAPPTGVIVAQPGASSLNAKPVSKPVSPMSGSSLTPSTSSNSTPVPSPNRTGGVAAKVGLNGRARRQPVVPRFSADAIITEAHAKREGTDSACNSQNATPSSGVSPALGASSSGLMLNAPSPPSGASSWSGSAPLSASTSSLRASSSSLSTSTMRSSKIGLGRQQAHQHTYATGKYFVLHVDFEKQLPLQLIICYASTSPAEMYSLGCLTKTIYRCIQHNPMFWDMVADELYMWRRLGFAGAQGQGKPSVWRKESVSEFASENSRKASARTRSSESFSATKSDSPPPEFLSAKSKDSQESGGSRQSSEIILANIDPLVPFPPRVAPFGDLLTTSPDRTVFQKLCLYHNKSIDDSLVELAARSTSVGKITALDLRGTMVTDVSVRKIMEQCVNLESLNIENCENVTAITLSMLTKQYPMVRATSFVDDKPHQAPEFYRSGRPCNIPVDRTPLAWGNFRGSPIIDNLLYLGDAADSRAIPELRSIGIKRILSVAQECPPSDDVSKANDLDAKWMPLRDHSDEDIATSLAAGVNYIREGIKRNEPVLVHCRHGVSRSATFIIAYIMRYGTSPDGTKESLLSYEDAFNHAKSRRPQISPNLGFVLALHDFDAELRGAEAAHWDHCFTDRTAAQLTETWEDFE